MKRKIFLAWLLVLAVVYANISWPTGIFTVTTEATSDEESYADSITLYALDPSYEDVLTIPADYAQSYQIKDDAAISYSIYSGESVTVSADGLIEPAYETWYSSGFFSTTMYIEGATTYKQLVLGTSVVRVTTSSGYYLLSVTVEDYTEVYADQVIDDYIAENISSDMTDEELLDAICRFPASYDYSASYSSATSMIIFGGGDCWASTNLIIETCERLGITAWSRNASNDYGAGSGHRNAIVELNGAYYQLEAGYVGTAPRRYDVTPRSSLFDVYSVEDGVQVYQYNGNETGEYVLEIPEEIDGEPVVGIADDFYAAGYYSVTEVIIPDTVTYIGRGAFNSFYSLTDLNIPASVCQICDFVFTECYSLSNFTCDSDNPYYTIVDGVLYDKDMTTVYYAPYVSEIVLPDTVQTIESYSLYYNFNLTYLYIPASVTYMGVGAVGTCPYLTCVEFEEGGNLVTDVYTFRECSDLTKIKLPSSMTDISDYVFYSCSSLSRIEIPTSITSIGDYAFEYCESLTDIYYLGSESEWNEITVGSNNTYLTSATVHFNSAMPDYTLADVNEDGEINYLDAMMVLRYDAELTTLTDAQLLAGDVNGDGSVNSLDAILILRYDAGLITSF